MKKHISIVGMVITVFLLGMMSFQNTTAQEELVPLAVGRYQIEKIDDFTNLVWKIDTLTGDIWRCQMPTQAADDWIRGCGRVIR